MRRIKQLWFAILGWWLGPAENPTRPSGQSARPRKPPQRCGKDLVDFMNGINECHEMLGVLKKGDRTAYEYHRRIGACVPPTKDFDEFQSIRLDAFSEKAKKVMPAQGMIFWPSHYMPHAKDYSVPMFEYFMKVERGPWRNLCKQGAALYEVFVVFIWDGKPRGISFHVVTDGDKSLAVPMPEAKTQRIRARRRRTGEESSEFSVTHKTMGLPEFLTTMWEDKDDRPKSLREEGWGRTIEEFGGYLLNLTVNAYVAGLDRWQFTVLAEKNGRAARFNVAVDNPKWFFRDRRTEVTSRGRKKPIIHWVEPHQRSLSQGRTADVSGHFRGSIEFDWGASHIRILMPRAALDPRGFNVPASDIADLSPEEQRRFIGPKRVAADLRRLYLEEASDKRAASKRKDHDEHARLDHPPVDIGRAA